MSGATVARSLGKLKMKTRASITRSLSELKTRRINKIFKALTNKRKKQQTETLVD